LTYDLVVRSEAATWEAGVVVFRDSAIVIPNVGSCLELMRPLRRWDATSEAWPCYGLADVNQFVIVIDRRYPPKAWWFVGPVESAKVWKEASACAIRNPDDGPPTCIQFKDPTGEDASRPRGCVVRDLIPRAPARP
jgi:hypothetical protein